MTILFEIKKLKKKDYFTNKDTWKPILESFQAKRTLAAYNLQDNQFELGTNGTFVPGDADTAQVIAKYCDYQQDKEETSIENYVDILKDLCTE